MADGREIHVWDAHAEECREQNRTPFEFYEDSWLMQQRVALGGITTVLDVGCGPGYWIKLFEGLDYTGVDQSPGMLALAQELSPLAKFVLGNARSLSEVFSPGSFDLAFTSSVLQHNRHIPDKQEVVEQIALVLRGGGYLLCTENTYRADNCPESVNNPSFTDGYTFTPTGWEIFMKALGFRLLAYNGQSEYLYQKVRK